MTPHQTLTVAAIGGLTALLGLALFTGLAIGLYHAVQHVIDAQEEHRARRHDLATCKAIDALGPTSTKDN